MSNFSFKVCIYKFAGDFDEIVILLSAASQFCELLSQRNVNFCNIITVLYRIYRIVIYYGSIFIKIYIYLCFKTGIFISYRLFISRIHFQIIAFDSLQYFSNTKLLKWNIYFNIIQNDKPIFIYGYTRTYVCLIYKIYKYFPFSFSYFF